MLFLRKKISGVSLDEDLTRADLVTRKLGDSLNSTKTKIRIAGWR